MAWNFAGGVVDSTRRTIVAWNFRGGWTWDRDSAVQGRDSAADRPRARGVWGGRESGAEGSMGLRGAWGVREYGAEGSLGRMGVWGGREAGADSEGAWGGWEPGVDPLT